MIFQDPMTSLNPVLTDRQADPRGARDALRHRAARTADRRAAELLDQVGIPSAKSRLRNYPHQFSGGMRQRAMIAMALACEPKLLIADEPTTALDVTIQAQILDLLRALVAEQGTALIMITHDLGVVAGMCERVNVMYAGTFVETGTRRRDLRVAAAPVHARPAAERAASRHRAPAAAAARSRDSRETCSARRRRARSRHAAASCIEPLHDRAAAARRARHGRTRPHASTPSPRTSGSEHGSAGPRDGER